MSRLRLVRIDLAPWAGRLDRPLANARRTWRSRRGLLLRLEDERGRVGVGEASPLPGYSPDRLGACAVALRRLDPRALELDPDEPPVAQIQAALELVDPGLPAARFALETALLELLGAELPATPALSPAAALVTCEGEARAAAAAGAAAVKLKIGRPGALAAELELAAAIRTAIGPDLPLRLDANGALPPGDARSILAAFAPLAPEWIEEPVPLAAIDSLLPSPIPIAVDESLTAPGGVDDALARLGRGQITALVLKPTLLGGRLRCHWLAGLAAAAGGRACLSHCLEGPVGRAALSGAVRDWPGLSGAVRDWPGLSGTEPDTLGLSGTEPDTRGLSGTEPDTRGLSGTEPDTRGLSRTEPDTLGLSRTEPDTLGLSRTEPDTLGLSGTALVVDGREHGWGEIEARMAAERRVLRRAGAATGVPFPVVAERRLDVAVRLFALWELGAVTLLLDPDAGDEERRARIAAAAACRLSGPGAIVFTSGSTGRPRGVVLPWAALAASAAASAANLGWRTDDRWLCCLPLHHVGGLSVLARSRIARRAAVLAPPRVDAVALAELIERDRITLASLVPTQLARLVDAGWQPPARLRAVLVGGAAAAPALLRRALERGVPVLRTYGMSETASQVCTDRAGERPEVDAGIPPLTGVELAIGDGGVIRVRGPMVCAGYLPPERAALDRDGWFTTSDRGELDAAGRLRALGRADDVIVTGGENVDPLEVEAALLELPGVAAACVFGVPDPEWGQLVAAALVAEPIDRAALGAAVRARLAGPRRPRRICLLPSLPLGPGGKLDRRAAARAAAPLLQPI